LRRAKLYDTDLLAEGGEIAFCNFHAFGGAILSLHDKTRLYDTDLLAEGGEIAFCNFPAFGGAIYLHGDLRGKTKRKTLTTDRRAFQLHKTFYVFCSDIPPGRGN